MVAWLCVALLNSTALISADPVAVPQGEELKLLKTFHAEFVPITPGKDQFPSSKDVVEPFQMAKYEVPQNLWQAVLGSNPSKWKGPRNSVEMLSLAEAKEFCEKVTQKLRAAKLIEQTASVRLPTEAEWEYTAAAGTKTKYSFGDQVADLADYGWYTANAAGNDPPVGAKKPNPWGIYDVHGYLWEWCTTAKGPVLKSGSWKEKADQLETTARKIVDADLRSDDVGLRCVLVTLAAAADGKFTPTQQTKLVPASSKLEQLWGDGEFTEGPALAPDGSIVFSDIGTRILRFDPSTKETTVFRDPSGRSNGLLFDAQGRLIVCEGANTGGNRRISITAGIQGEKDGKIETLADNFQGKRFNSPNDLAIDGQNRVYFTDPRYVGDDPRDLDFEAVFLVAAPVAGKKSDVVVATREVQKPNGILVSADGKTVYIADNNPKGNVHLVAMAVQKDGTLADKRVLFDFVSGRGIDGMTLDTAGNIYATAGTGEKSGIYVFSPQGEHLAFIATPGDPTNCTFGANQQGGAYLYITAATGPKKNDGSYPKFGLFRIQLPAQGQPLPKAVP